MMTGKIPLDVLNTKLRAVLREHDRHLTLDCEFAHGWLGAEYVLHIGWPDGLKVTLGFGPEASAVIEAFHAMKH